jgi:iron complex outermembrane receptor protein
MLFLRKGIDKAKVWVVMVNIVGRSALLFLGKSLVLTGLFSAVVVQAVGAQDSSQGSSKLSSGEMLDDRTSRLAKDIPRTGDVPQPATTVKEWVAQMEADTVQVTGVRLSAKDAGLDIILETQGGKPLKVDASKFRTEGNSLIADIPNAVLALPNAPDFNANRPTEDIANVRVAQLDAVTIRVSVAGDAAPPKTAVALKVGELVYSLTPEAEELDEEEIVATGQDQRDNTSVGTKTDTPLRDIPQSIQVVPRQVIQDTQSRNLAEALENVPGVLTQGSGIASPRTYLTIRGFENYNGLLNGLPDPQIFSDNIFFNVERVEVLKGPASVLYGDGGFGNIGGTVNYVTRRPLKNPFFEVEASVSAHNFYEGTVDVSGPLNTSKSVLGRFIAGYQSDGSYIDFNASQAVGFAPSLSFQLGSKSNLILEGDLTITEREMAGTLPVIGTLLPNPNGKVRSSFNSAEPPAVDNLVYNGRIGYQFEHKFNENLILRNAFRYVTFLDNDRDNDIFNSDLDADNRTLNRSVSKGSQYYHYFLVDTNLLSKFKRVKLSIKFYLALA